MKKTAVIIATVSLALSAPLASFAMDQDSMPMDHGSMKMDHGSTSMDHGSMKMEHGGHMMGKVAHEEVVDGVKVTFSVLDIKAKMKEMGMKETHHIMVMFKDAKSGTPLSDGEVAIKVMGPGKMEQVKNLMGMAGGFGADFIMPKAGKYGVMAKFKLKGEKVRSAKFWYTVK